jgi:tight adherence protein C
LGNRISARQSRIRRGLPDVLDLMVICIEAGLSLDQAVSRTAEELSLAQPVVCDELAIVVLEQRAGAPRADAWRHLAERTNVDSVRNLVSVLVQAEKFGTSIAKTLRIHSDTLRTQRRQKVEEQAAKTTVKLVFPLVLFIFPSLFLVTLGPAMITIMESFDKYLTQ